MGCTSERPDNWDVALKDIDANCRDIIECYVFDLENRHRNLQDYVTHVLLPAKSVTVLIK